MPNLYAYEKPRRKLTRRLGWSWIAKEIDGKKTFMVCFLGTDGWSSWIEEKTGESRWLTIAKAIAASGGYMLLPTSRYGKTPTITVVTAPRSVEEILIEGDLL